MNDIKKSDYSYELPPELIAQTPADKRDASRMLVIGRESGALEHKHFYDLPDFLKAGDVVVINDSKVLPARLYGESEKGAAVELVLLEARGGDRWEELTRPGKRTMPGDRIIFGGGKLTGEVMEIVKDGNRVVRFTYEGDFYELIDAIGSMPLPPYITEPSAPERYQTVYAKEPGSAAAPTAGLHFTKEMLSGLEASGIHIAPVTLHVGLGTFRPVKSELIKDHVMHSESYFIPERSCELINRAKREGAKVLAIGTTSMRTLEAASSDDGVLTPGSGRTDIFIYEGYRFKMVNALLTNFHLPESTLIMLVAAFSSRQITLNAYNEAVKERYRFYSFGDCCLLM